MIYHPNLNSNSENTPKDRNFHPITSIILNPLRASEFLTNSPLLQNQETIHEVSDVRLFMVGTVPHLVYSGGDSAVLGSLITVSKHLICYYIESELESVIETKWWEHKSLSHMYHIDEIPALYFFNSRIKANKQLQGGKLNYLLDEEVERVMSGIRGEEVGRKEPLSLAQTCRLLEMFVRDREYFQQKEYFTDRLNYIQLFRLESDRLLNEEIGDMISAQANLTEITRKIYLLEPESKRSFERKIKKLEIFRQIAEKQKEKQVFLETRLKSSQEDKETKLGVELVRRSRWHTNRAEYLQRLTIIILTIILVQIVLGHNLLSLTISLVLAIFYLKFID